MVSFFNLYGLNDTLTISEEAEKQIKFFEGGPYLKAYKGAGGHYLIGWGHNCGNSTLQISMKTANQIFWKDIKRAGDKIKKDVTVPLTQNQFSVLVDLYFNLGIYNWKKRQILIKLNSGDYKGAGEEILKYVHTSYINKKGKKIKRVLPGLVRRRNFFFKLWNS